MISRIRQLLGRRHISLSISVVMLLMSVVLVADLLKLRGGQSSDQELRTAVAETLAIQISLLAAENDIRGVDLSLRQFVKRHSILNAASVVDQSGVTLAAFGDMAQLEQVTSQSTLTHINVPVYDGADKWGDIKVVFEPAQSLVSELKYFAFLLVGSFIACLLYLRRILVQLDPGRVVPKRVDSAFNMFTECVVILNSELRILVVNDAVESMLGKTSEQLLGKSLDDWGWEIDQSDDWRSPWSNSLATGSNVADVKLTLDVNGEKRTLIANCSVVGGDAAQGVLVTLNDMTAIETKNEELAETLTALKQTEQQIITKNKELEFLATRDALSGLYNRRAFLDNINRAFAVSTEQGSPLFCLMVDIDHFKRINDTFGHAVGDQIIKSVAEVLVEFTDETDLVARYGGEEFIIMMSDKSMDESEMLANTLREQIIGIVDTIETNIEYLSASFGLAKLTPDVENVADLIDRADQALYYAKKSGRNRVICFSENIKALQENLQNKDSDSATESAALQRVVELEAKITESSRDLSLLRTYDSLTGFVNRSLFYDRIDHEIERAKRLDNTIAVVAAEIQDFDKIVSTFGHTVVDQLVVDFVNRLKEAVRTTDIATSVTDGESLSRITSNEYGLLLSELRDTDSVLPVLARLKRLLAKPFTIDGQKVYVGACLGIAMYPQNGGNSKKLLEAATAARVLATEVPGKFAHVFANESIDKSSREYIEIESDLHDALKNDEFSVLYQPKLDVKTNSIHSVEALLRWHHPEKGQIPNDKFIAIAESNGFIEDISDIVVQKSLQQLRQWRNEGWTDLRLSINISAMQLRRKELALSILAALKKAQIPTHVIELEITETSIIESTDDACKILNDLRDAGVRIAMDDFGVGHTSMALLADLPLDGVKIDQSFVKDIVTNKRNKTLVEFVIGLAHSLDLKVVAEGVESQGELELLSQLGCDEIQGYLISRAIDGEALSALLRQYNNTVLNLPKSA